MAWPTDPIIFDTVRDHLAIVRDFNWTAGTVRAVVLNRLTWTPNASDTFVATATSAGATALGTRQTLASPTATLSGVDHCVYWDANPIVYPGIALSAAFDTLLLYRFVTVDADSYLIAVYDLGSQVGDGASVTLNPDTNGYVKV